MGINMKGTMSSGNLAGNVREHIWVPFLVNFPSWDPSIVDSAVFPFKARATNPPQFHS